MSLRASTISLTSNITTACSTSSSFTFARIWKSREWRWLRQRASASRVFLASDLPLVFFGTARAFPFDWAGVNSPSSSVSSSTSMDEGALLLGPALADGRTVLPPVEPMSHGRESETADLLFVVLMMTAAAAELPTVSVGFLCPCHPCAKLQRSLADLHWAQAAPVPYAHSAVTPAFLQASHAPSVPTSRTAGAETFRLMMADSAATPSSSCSRTLWKSVSPVRQTNGVATHLACGRGDRHHLG